MERVRTYCDFNIGNDPHGEHDCFLFDLEGERFMVKIDYYDRKLEYGSEDPADPPKTTCVITIMLASITCRSTAIERALHIDPPNRWRRPHAELGLGQKSAATARRQESPQRPEALRKRVGASG